MTDQDKTTYDKLKAQGHSPVKAAQIMLDAKRGDKFAKQWIKFLMKDD